MRWYWSVTSLPELADLPADQRWQHSRRCYWSILRHWQVWAAMLVAGVFPLGGVLAGGYLLTQSLWTALLGLAIGCGVGGFFFLQIACAYLRPHLRAERSRV